MIDIRKTFYVFTNYMLSHNSTYLLVFLPVKQDFFRLSFSLPSQIQPLIAIAHNDFIPFTLFARLILLIQSDIDYFELFDVFLFYLGQVMERWAPFVYKETL